MDIESIQLDPEDIILLLVEANERLLGKAWLSGITRFEKPVFLLERETRFEGIGDFFRFEPHNFGPFSKEVYEAVEFLSSCELIDVREKAYPSLYSSSDEAKPLKSRRRDTPESGNAESQVTEKQFSLTENGRKVAQIMHDAIKRRRPSDVEELDGIVRRYGTRPLNQLIRYVYRQHPEMIVKSIHPEARRVSNAAHRQPFDACRRMRDSGSSAGTRHWYEPIGFVRRSSCVVCPLVSVACNPVLW